MARRSPFALAAIACGGLVLASCNMMGSSSKNTATSAARGVPFGAALSAIQAINGRWFEPVQGGTFAPGPSEELVRRMAEWGASGVGQSSWGPAVYGIVDGENAGLRLAERVRALSSTLGAAGSVYEGPFRAGGA